MPVSCNRCGMSLPEWELASGDVAHCKVCGAENIVRVFPAMLAPAEGPVRTETALDGEATCYDHPAKRAVTSCRQCGRFVCQLCAVSFKGEAWCPSCVASGNPKAKPADLENARTLYDSMALTVALAPVPFLWPLTMVSAPAALFLSMRYWKRPLSILRRTRFRFVLAICLSLAQITAWIWGLAYFFVRAKTRI